jgi:hypothetical protein
MAELCERIIWSGGGTEAGRREEDMMKECRGALASIVIRKAGPGTNKKTCSYMNVCMRELSQASVLTCCGTTSA